MTDDIRATTFVRAGRGAVWDALTSPEAITAFHPAGMVAVPLDRGGRGLMRPDTGETFIREALISKEGGHRLAPSFEAAWAEAPEGGSVVTFEISEEAEGCKVTASQSNCAAFGIGDTWDRFLASMKSHPETGRGLHIPPGR